MTNIHSIATPQHLNRSDEQNLIKRMLHGEEKAFVEFVQRYKDRLLTAVRSHVGCQHDAEEIVQETFIKALVHLPDFQHQSQLYSWIYRIALNTSSSRRRRSRNEVSLESCGARTTSSAPEWTEPQFPMEQLERISLLQRALAKIESRHRQILTLREFDDLSYQEIAERLAVPLGTVRSRLARARERLREELVALDNPPGGTATTPTSNAPKVRPTHHSIGYAPPKMELN
ncbi:MAG: RNA polymerase sigma factor [Planctomycetales bacterium]|nr:RNA polymerase sigma factor [Planctomycetales bacterium]